MCFYFSHLTCTFHFNCCLNKIFVIVRYRYRYPMSFELFPQHSCQVVTIPFTNELSDSIILVLKLNTNFLITH